MLRNWITSINFSCRVVPGPDLRKGDCRQLLKTIPNGSIDAVITDPPYGIMKGIGEQYGSKDRHLWDVAISPDLVFQEAVRVLRPNGRLILFSQEPYTSNLITSAIPEMPFNYRLTWLKDSFANSLGVNKAPVSVLEDIIVFTKNNPKYDFDSVHPLRPYFKKVFDFIGISKKEIFKKVGTAADHCLRFNSTQFSIPTERTYSDIVLFFGVDAMPGFKRYEDIAAIDAEVRADIIRKATDLNPSIFNLPEGAKHKKNVLVYPKDRSRHHPTQKPVALMEDLIRTYTNEGDTVLDFTMGSGSTGVAAIKAKRKFIGFEMDPHYYQTATNRIENETK